MSSTKIINVVKDDSFEEVFDLFKNTAAEEVIFILPKKSKALNSEEQFQQIRAEAQQQGKKLSLMSSNEMVVTLARQHDFEILHEKSSAPKRVAKKKVQADPVPVLARADEPDDDELVPDDSPAFDPLTPSDETMGIIDDKEEEEGKVVDQEEVLEHDAAGDTVDEAPLEEEEKEEPVDGELQDEDGIDESSVYPDDPPVQLEDPEFAVGQGDEPVPATLAGARRFDGMVPTSGSKHSLRVQGADKAVPLGVRKGKVSKQNLQEIAEVWQHEPYERGESMWTGIRNPHEKSSMWSRLFAKKPAAQLARPSPVVRTSGTRRFLWSFLVVTLLAGAGVVYVTTGSAQIVIIPFSKQLDFEVSANVSDQFASVDGTFNKLPGQLFTVEKSATQEFPATGQREVAQKAKGKITIYNTFSASPQTLIATTRFESTQGLIFHTLRTVSVPGMSGTTPGSVEVEVIADKAGSTYNIAPGRFTVPAFKEKGDTARYQKFYAISQEAMKDGISGISKVVTESDFMKAKEIVQQKLREEILETLGQETSGLKIADAAEITITNTDTSAIVDQAADSFTVTIKGYLKTMGFREEDLWSLIKQNVSKNFGLAAVEDKLSIEYREAKLNDSRGVLELTVKLTGNGYGQINSDKIIQDLLGKGENDIVGYLKEADGVAEAKVLLSPFWVKKVPKNKEKVGVQIDYQ